MARGTNGLMLAALGAGAYVVYRLFRPGGIASQATSAVSSGIANAIVGSTNFIRGSYNIQPTGNVILPNGSKVRIADVQNMMWDAANNVASFVYQGYGYIIPPDPAGGPAYDQNGDYHAQ